MTLLDTPEPTVSLVKYGNESLAKLQLAHAQLIENIDGRVRRIAQLRITEEATQKEIDELEAFFAALPEGLHVPDVLVDWEDERTHHNKERIRELEGSIEGYRRDVEIWEKRKLEIEGKILIAQNETDSCPAYTLQSILDFFSTQLENASIQGDYLRLKTQPLKAKINKIASKSPNELEVHVTDDTLIIPPLYIHVPLVQGAIKFSMVTFSFNSGFNDNAVHPHHMGSGSGCFGDFESPIHEALESRDLLLVIEFILLFLSQINTDGDDAGRSWPRMFVSRQELSSAEWLNNHTLVVHGTQVYTPINRPPEPIIVTVKGRDFRVAFKGCKYEPNDLILSGSDEDIRFIKGFKRGFNKTEIYKQGYNEIPHLNNPNNGGKDLVFNVTPTNQHPKERVMANIGRIKHFLERYYNPPVEVVAAVEEGDALDLLIQTMNVGDTVGDIECHD